MTPAESDERDRMAYVLDALLATVAVALNTEQIRATAEFLQEQKRLARIGLNADWLRRAS